MDHTERTMRRALWRAFRIHPLVVALMIAALGVALAARPCRADHVVLENGTVFEGDSVPINSLLDPIIDDFNKDPRPNPNRLLLIDQGYRRYVVPLRQVREDEEEALLPSYDFFEIPQTTSSSQLGLLQIGLPKKVTPFDEHGVRTVVLSGPNQQPIKLVQGVTRITPKYVTVEGINHEWWQGIATHAFPSQKLIALIASAIDPADPDDRLSVARFLIQAGRYELASVALAGIKKDFPDLTDQVAELEHELNQLRASKLLTEVRRRRAAGQHRLALSIVRSFPVQVDFDAKVSQQIATLHQDFRDAHERSDKIMLRLGELEAQLDDPDLRAAAAEMRYVVGHHLDWNSLSRFDAFLTLADDESLPPADRLALAYSGWMAGSAEAVTNFPQTRALWDARWLVKAYLRADDSGREAEILAKLAAIESIGPTQIANVLPLLPPWGAASGLRHGGENGIVVVETEEAVKGWGSDGQGGQTVLTDQAGPVRYAVALPPGYSPTRAYPMIVALRPAEWTITREAAFWAVREAAQGQPRPGPAAQAGYIVIAPEYAGEGQVRYQYAATAHRAILAAIRDAKSRLLINSDRVFLVGHGMGADATFDLALSQPRLFAGAVPISGMFRQQIAFEKQSAATVPFYVVNGEYDRNTRAQQGDELAYLMYHGHDIIYCEHVGRGYGYYPGEINDILAWMRRFSRDPLPREFQAQISRTSDTRSYWISTQGIPQRFFVGRRTQRGRIPNPFSLEVRISSSNTITLSSPTPSYVLRLNSELVNLDERVRVRLGTRQQFNEFVEPNIADLLKNIKETGDRQRLYPIRLHLN